MCNLTHCAPPWDGWANTAEDHVGFLFCQSRTKTKPALGTDSAKLYRRRQTQSGLLNLDFCRTTQMDHGPILPCVNSSEWWRCFDDVRKVFFTWLGPVSNHCLNDMAYLSIVADYVYPLIGLIYYLLMASSSIIMHRVTNQKLFNCLMV